MVDDSRLDYLRTFLGKVHTAATVNHIEEVSSIRKIADAERMLVHTGTVMKEERYEITLRYKVDIEADTEINLSTALNNIAIGIRKLNSWTAITAYTRESTLHHIDNVNGGEAKFNGKNKKWTQTIELQVVWGLSL